MLSRLWKRPSASPVALNEPTLGFELKRIEETRHKAIKAEEDARLAKQRQLWAREKDEIRKFLSAVRVSIIHDIKHGRQPQSVILPNNILVLTGERNWFGFNSGTGLPQYRAAYVEVLEELIVWGQSQNLRITLCNKGTESLKVWLFEIKSQL